MTQWLSSYLKEPWGLSITSRRYQADGLMGPDHA
jgi:hypothetical protein